MASNVIKVLVLLWTASCIITRLERQNTGEETTTELPQSNCSLIHFMNESSGVIEGPNCIDCVNSTEIVEICENWVISGGEGEFVLLTLEFNNETLARNDTLIIKEGTGSQSEIVRYGETSGNPKTIKVASLTSAITVEYVGTDSTAHGSFQFNYSIEPEATRQTTLSGSWGFINVTGGEDYLNYQHTWFLGNKDSNISIDIEIENSMIYDPKEGGGYDFSPPFEPNNLKRTIVYGSHLSIGAGTVQIAPSNTNTITPVTKSLLLGHSVLKENTAYMTSGEVTKPVRLKIARDTAYIYMYATDFSLPDFGFYLTYNLTDLPQITTVPPTTPSPYANHTGNYSVGIVDLSKDTFVNSQELPREFQRVMLKYTELYCNGDDPMLKTQVQMADVMLASHARKGCYVGFQLGLTDICHRNNRPFDVESLSEMLEIYGYNIKEEFGYKVVMEFVYSKVGWIILITTTVVCTFIAILVIGMAKRKYHYKKMKNYSDYKPPAATIMPEPYVNEPTHQQTLPADPNIYTTQESVLQSETPGHRMFNKAPTAKKFLPSWVKPTLHSPQSQQQIDGMDNISYKHTETTTLHDDTDEEDISVYSARPSPRESSSESPVYDTVYGNSLDHRGGPSNAIRLGSFEATQV